MADTTAPRSRFWQDFWAGLAGPGAYMSYVAGQAVTQRDEPTVFELDKAGDAPAPIASPSVRTAPFRSDVSGAPTHV